MPFVIRCSRAIFSEEEIHLLERYGKAFERLSDGSQTPTTEAQRRFVEVAVGRAEPVSIYERTWVKYLARLEWEREPSNRMAMATRRQFPDDRDDWKQMRGAVWVETRRRAQGLAD